MLYTDCRYSLLHSWYITFSSHNCSWVMTLIDNKQRIKSYGYVNAELHTYIVDLWYTIILVYMFYKDFIIYNNIIIRALNKFTSSLGLRILFVDCRYFMFNSFFFLLSCIFFGFFFVYLDSCVNPLRFKV